MTNSYVLQDLIAESKDGEWGKGEPFDGSVEMIVVRATDFADVQCGRPGLVPVRFIPPAIAARKTLRRNDIIIETAGGGKDRPTGRTQLLRQWFCSRASFPITCASFCRFIRIDESKADPIYVYWLLQGLYAAGFMKQFHTQHTGVARFQYTTFATSQKISLPSRSVQRKTASILSSYDDLIENNTRRIAILEAMAQAIYREWFVEFRFPGHEKVKLVDSLMGEIPAGWEITPLKRITTKIGSGATPRGGKEAYKSSGITLIRSLNIYDYQFDHDGLAYIDADQAAQLDNVVVEKRDILLNITGASVARCCMVPSYLLPARVNQHVAIIRVNTKTCDPFYVLNTINNERHKRQILALAQGGATREALTKDTISNYEIVLPPLKILKAYSEVVTSLFDQRELLQRKNNCLRTTRDVLLPKLISGHLGVDELDIDIGAAVTE
jgi:type I restriction enzyme S subunit